MGTTRVHENCETSISLIDRAREKVPDAWFQLTTIYTPLIRNWTRRAGMREHDSADITQEVFRRVSQNLSEFRKNAPGDTFRGWLWTITRNECRQWYRKQQRVGEVAFGGTDAMNRMAALSDWVAREDATEELPPDPDTESQLIRRAADLIRQDFQTRTWTAFWRSAVEGHTTDEIAADLDMKPGAIRQAKLRVLKRFREVLDS